MWLIFLSLFVHSFVFASGFVVLSQHKPSFFYNLCSFQKHEREVLAVVEKSRQAEQRRRGDEGTMERKRKKKLEEEEGVHKAMMASLNEGWSLLLRLLEKRQEVLTLASDFYCRALEVLTV